MDVLIFNPPYVPTPSEEVWQPSKVCTLSLLYAYVHVPHPNVHRRVHYLQIGGGIEASWAGGVCGREVSNTVTLIEI